MSKRKKEKRCFYENRIEDETWLGLPPCGKPGCTVAVATREED